MSVQDVSLNPGFWEVGAYKTNVRRIKEGIDQIDELSKMAKERADIEHKYAKALQAFAEKWRGHVERSAQQEGSIRMGWLEVIGEGDALATQHMRVRERLLDEIVKTLALYRKENHHSSAFRSPKEIRETEEAFEKAQKQWKKLHEKMEAAKKAYHNACRAEKSTAVNVSNAQADTSISPDALSKMKERHSRARDDVTKTRTLYQNQLQEIAQYRGPYIENMTFVFEKCQQAEMKRSKFVIEMLSCKQKVLADLHRSSKLASVHAKIEEALRGSDEAALQADLKAWSAMYGVDAPCDWPSYQEYTPEMRQIAAVKGNSKETGGVVLTRQIIKNDDITPASLSSMTTSSHILDPSRMSVVKADSDSDTNTFDSRASAKQEESSASRGGTAASSTLPSATIIGSGGWADGGSDSLPTTTPDSAKYADFDEETTPTAAAAALNGGAHKGSLARVLYDYTPIEDDEIELKKGQTIELLSEPDSLGWCTVRNGSVSGLFPAAYVQAI